LRLKDDSPTLVSPSKNIAAHGCRILDDENDVADEEKHDQEVVELYLDRRFGSAKVMMTVRYFSLCHRF
jgi:hypothetical protein